MDLVTDKILHAWGELAKLSPDPFCDHEWTALADMARVGANLEVYSLCRKCGGQQHERGHIYITKQQQDAVVRFLANESAA